MGQYNPEDPSTIENLIAIASNDRIFNALDKGTQSGVLRILYKYTREVVRKNDLEEDLANMSDEEFYEQYGRR